MMMDSGLPQTGGIKVTGILPVWLGVVSVSRLGETGTHRAATRALFVTELADFFNSAEILATAPSLGFVGVLLCSWHEWECKAGEQGCALFCPYAIWPRPACSWDLHALDATVG